MGTGAAQAGRPGAGVAGADRQGAGDRAAGFGGGLKFNDGRQFELAMRLSSASD